VAGDAERRRDAVGGTAGRHRAGNPLQAARIAGHVLRLSGTGTEGATLRVYFERFEADAGRHDVPTQQALRPLFECAETIAGIGVRTGRSEPTVIT